MSSLTVQLVHITAKLEEALQEPDLALSCSILGLSSSQASDLPEHVRQAVVWFALLLEEGPSEFHLDFSLFAVTW